MRSCNLDYQARDIVALVARVVIEERPVDFYVTHLYMSRGDDSVRLFQVQQLLQWIDSRADGTPGEPGPFSFMDDGSSVLPSAAVASLSMCRRRHEAANLSREQAGEFDRRRVLILRADNLQAHR